MKKLFSSELVRVINQQAHTLAAQSFVGIRMTLQDKASEMLRQGKSPDETVKAIRAAGLHHESHEQSI